MSPYGDEVRQEFENLGRRLAELVDDFERWRKKVHEDEEELVLGPVGRFLLALQDDRHRPPGTSISLREKWGSDGPNPAIEAAYDAGLINDAARTVLETYKLDDLDRYVRDETRKLEADVGPDPTWVRIWVRPPGGGHGG